MWRRVALARASPVKDINEVRRISAVSGKRLTSPDISALADLQVVEQRDRDM